MRKSPLPKYQESSTESDQSHEKKKKDFVSHGQASTFLERPRALAEQSTDVYFATCLDISFHYNGFMWRPTG